MSYPDVATDPNAGFLEQLACWMPELGIAASLAIGLGNLGWTFKKVGPLALLSVGILGIDAYILYYKWIVKGCGQPQSGGM